MKEFAKKCESLMQRALDLEDERMKLGWSFDSENWAACVHILGRHRPEITVWRRKEGTSDSACFALDRKEGLVLISPGRYRQEVEEIEQELVAWMEEFGRNPKKEERP